MNATGVAEKHSPEKEGQVMTIVIALVLVLFLWCLSKMPCIPVTPPPSPKQDPGPPATVPMVHPERERAMKKFLGVFMAAIGFIVFVAHNVRVIVRGVVGEEVDE